MKDRSKLRERFLRDHISIQLGNIASNLARIADFIPLEFEQAAIPELLDESKFMVEWAAPFATLEQQFNIPAYIDNKGHRTYNEQCQEQNMPFSHDRPPN